MSFGTRRRMPYRPDSANKRVSAPFHHVTMSRWWRTNTCERATQWISLDLDGELSQLEQAALARHLLSCARCQAVSSQVSSFTRMLREAPLIEFEREPAYASPGRISA